jgi:hypothetical protein
MIDFAEALSVVKLGGKVKRRGWNGKNMFIYMHKGSAPVATAVEPTDFGMDLISGIDKDLYEDGDQGTIIRLPSIAFRAATGETVIGWAPSQADLFAEDWVETA